MEFSAYFFHSNGSPYCVSFVNDTKSQLIEIIVSPICHRGYVVIPDKEFRFIVTPSELFSSENLSFMYNLSLIATQDKHQLFPFSLDEGFDDIIDASWFIRALPNHKGLTYSSEYIPTYGFDEVPTQVSILNVEENNAKKAKYLHSDDYFFTTCYRKASSQLLHMFASDIEEDIEVLEKNLFMLKKNLLFIKKIVKKHNLNDDIAKILLSKCV